MARLRSAPAPQQNVTAIRSTRQALKEKTNTTGTGATVANEFKDFVKDARPTRGRARKAAENGEEFIMAGGLGQRSDAPVSEAPTITDELAKSDGPVPTTARANKRPPRQARKPAQSVAQNKVFEDMKRRMRATAQKEAATDRIVDLPSRSENAGPSSDALPTKPPPNRMSNASRPERSDFSISPSPPPPGKLSAVKNKRSSTGRPEPVLKSQSTPMTETSVLALKNFKRRPRQPSMLAMVQQRAVSARPSAAHVHSEAEDPVVFDIEGDDEDEEDFAPDAEGTPLHLRKAKRASVLSERAPSTTSKKQPETRPVATAKKRKSADIDNFSSSLSALRAKRRKPMASTDDTAMPSKTLENVERPATSERQETPQLQIVSEVQVINSSPSTTPPTEPSCAGRVQRSSSGGVVVPSTEEQDQQNTGQRMSLNDHDNRDESPLNETMADPVSSSPLPEDPIIGTQGTDIMAEPLTQLTPPRPKRDREKIEKKQQRMMTATLQSMLPKRRQPSKPRHKKSEYDIDSDSEEDEQGCANDSDGDEQAQTGDRRRTKNAPAKSRKSTATTKPSDAAKKPTAPARNNRKSTAHPGRRKTATAGKKPAAKTGGTYGRNAASDKENDPTGLDFEDLSDQDDSALPDTSLTVHEVAQSGELAAAKAKFAEVDDWDMEFESVSFEEGRSSSQTWR